MQRRQVVLLFIATVFLLIDFSGALPNAGLNVALAYPPCPPYTTFPHDQPCSIHIFGPGELVMVTATVATVSLRSAPSSTAPVIATESAGTYLRLAKTNFSASDGQQGWLSARDDQQRVGWVEYNSVEQVPLTGRRLPVPCTINQPDIFMVVGLQRRHIADWQTFLSLGYVAADVVPCLRVTSYPEGAPVTRLVKGSGKDVYLMQNGVRRRIPNMDTLTALGYQTADITTLPDMLVALWPAGSTLPARRQSQTGCTAGYEGQVTLSFINQTNHMIWINGLDANCGEFHMWPVVAGGQTGPLALPARMLTVRIRDHDSNRLMSEYTISRAMDGQTITIVG